MITLDALVFRTRVAASDTEQAIVLFHGRGADENDLYPLFDLLDPDKRLPGITPRAPLTLPPGGAHWYIVRRIGEPDPETFSATYNLVGGWLEVFGEKTGVPPRRTVLGGFSQGAVMSYALGLGRGRPRPAAIIALSGFIPSVDGFELDLEQPLPPIAIGHGTHDPVIPVEFGRAARQRLEQAGAEVVYAEAPMQHSIDPTFLVRLRPWLRQAVDQGETAGFPG